MWEELVEVIAGRCRKARHNPETVISEQDLQDKVVYSAQCVEANYQAR